MLLCLLASLLCVVQKVPWFILQARGDKSRVPHRMQTDTLPAAVPAAHAGRTTGECQLPVWHALLLPTGMCSIATHQKPSNQLTTVMKVHHVAVFGDAVGNSCDCTFWLSL